jgi:hypothetical protein
LSWRGTGECSYFEAKWKPKAWKTPHRFRFIRTRVKQQHKEPIQLDLFVPHAYGCEFKVILSNKLLGARKVLVFHNGRGSQEGIFAELKSDNALGYIPTRSWVGNQIYLLSALLAHNLGRELQMIAHLPSRATLEKRRPFGPSNAWIRFGARSSSAPAASFDLRGNSLSVRPPIRRSKRNCCFTSKLCKLPEIPR